LDRLIKRRKEFGLALARSEDNGEAACVPPSEAVELRVAAQHVPADDVVDVVDGLLVAIGLTRDSESDSDLVWTVDQMMPLTNLDIAVRKVHDFGKLSLSALKAKLRMDVNAKSTAARHRTRTPVTSPDASPSIRNNRSAVRLEERRRDLVTVELDEDTIKTLAKRIGAIRKKADTPGMPAGLLDTFAEFISRLSTWNARIKAKEEAAIECDDDDEDETTIARDFVLGGDEDLHGLGSFRGLLELQRALLSLRGTPDDMRNPRVWRWVAWRTPVGLCTALTNHAQLFLTQISPRELKGVVKGKLKAARLFEKYSSAAENEDDGGMHRKRPSPFADAVGQSIVDGTDISKCDDVKDDDSWLPSKSRFGKRLKRSDTGGGLGASLTVEELGSQAIDNDAFFGNLDDDDDNDDGLGDDGYGGDGDYGGCGDGFGGDGFGGDGFGGDGFGGDGFGGDGFGGDGFGGGKFVEDSLELGDSFFGGEDPLGLGGSDKEN